LAAAFSEVLAHAGPHTNGSRLSVVCKDVELPPNTPLFGAIEQAGLALLHPTDRLNRCHSRPALATFGHAAGPACCNSEPAMRSGASPPAGRFIGAYSWQRNGSAVGSSPVWGGGGVLRH
jgi:hypothetical protein